MALATDMYLWGDRPSRTRMNAKTNRVSKMTTAIMIAIDKSGHFLHSPSSKAHTCDRRPRGQSTEAVERVEREVVNRVTIVGSHWAAEAIGTVADAMIFSEVAASTGASLPILDLAAVPRVQRRVPAAPNRVRACSAVRGGSGGLHAGAIPARCTNGAACGTRTAGCKVRTGLTRAPIESRYEALKAGHTSRRPWRWLHKSSGTSVAQCLACSGLISVDGTRLAHARVTVEGQERAS
eukprot:7376787-Prymnesium_polylepis.2